MVHAITHPHSSYGPSPKHDKHNEEWSVLTKKLQKFSWLTAHMEDHS